jgi:prepilin-type N-terminal cleavage/methylation domain-containing protein
MGRVTTVTVGSHAPGRLATGGDRGFTLVEMTTSVAVMLVVLTAAWLLLTTSNQNLNTIDFGGQTSEINRAALASFERDLNHSYLPVDDVSPVLAASDRSVTFMVDEDTTDGHVELVEWAADDANNLLVRTVTNSTEATPNPVAIADFAGGEVETRTVVAGLATGSELGTPALFTYGVDAKIPYDPDTDPIAMVRRIGLVTVHMRNGLPTRTTNVSDRIGAYRIIALVINGY